MKKIICVVLLLSVSFLVSVAVAAPTLTVEWEMKNPPNDLAGFNLYVNSKRVFHLTDPQARKWVGACPQCIENQENKFVMTSFDKSGLESVHSKPVIKIFNLRPPAPSILRIEILRINVPEK